MSVSTNDGYAGPQFTKMGLFNFSNHSIFSHELMNLYSSTYFGMVAPFNLFAKTIRHHYLNNGCTEAFCGVDLFCLAYYLWTCVQALGDSFSCPKYGPEPDTVILDRMAHSFPMQNLTEMLTPPTTILPSAPTQDKFCPPDDSTSCVAGKLRQTAQSLYAGE